jgi:hypothetical protein
MSATVCDSLQEASRERYFYECLTAMQQVMPASGAEFWLWADRVSKAVLRGEELYYCGLPKPPDEPPDPNARIGFVLEWFDHDGDLVGEHELEGMTPEGLQELLGDPDVDRVMCLTHPVAGNILGAVVAGRNISVDEVAFDYVVSPWADKGFRTPRGYRPPPRVLPAFPGGRKMKAPSAKPGDATEWHRVK